MTPESALFGIHPVKKEYHTPNHFQTVKIATWSKWAVSPTSGLYVGYNYCQSHVLVDTWMLTVKLVYKLLNVSDDLKLATNTRMTPFTVTFKA